MQKTILLVDDEINILKALARLLKTNGYRVLTASNPTEGFKILNEHPVKVIISDQRMPEMTGAVFLKKAREMYPETIRMLLSGYTDFYAIKDAINEGSIYKFINKPWNNDLLLHYVQEGFKLSLEKEKIDEKIYLFSHCDLMTNLQNRFSFNELLYSATIQAAKDTKKLAMIHIDIDRFSHINDWLGQEQGDWVLKTVANRLKNIIKTHNTLARLGNDEFAVLVVDEEDLANLDLLLEAIKQSISEPVRLSDTDFYLSISMGVSWYPKDGDNPHFLMKNANSALYYSRERGGDSYHIYDAFMENSSMEALFLEADLHQALANNEFVLYYQPIVDTNTSKLRGIEALIRWNHPTMGLILPARFLPLSEETGIIISIDTWVLKEVCCQIKKWRAQGLVNICVAVNISARQFNDPGLLSLILQVLEENDIPPSCLELEVTESLIMQNTEANVTLLKSLKSLGIELALDDFGIGYSSLSYLKHFPFTTLKVDKSFIDDITQVASTASLVRSIINMGKSLGLTLIAEGVEQQAQLDFLKENQCDMIQGYLYSRPLPEKEMTAFLLKEAKQLN